MTNSVPLDLNKERQLRRKMDRCWMLRYVLSIIALLGALNHTCHAWEETAPVLVGGRFSYSVNAGDYLDRIGARFGVAARVLAKENGIANPNLIFPGQTLRVDNRHIVPGSVANGIVVNLPQRMLFLFKDGRLVSADPVAVGKPNWPTVLGSFHVVALEKNPVWLVPKSIQEEMARESRLVESKVPPGETNPLGKFWIGLDAPGYGIHGTIAPDSIYHFQSHGCIRLHRDDIARLFPQVRRGFPVELIYVPVLLAETAGHTFVEVNPDPYRRAPPALDAVKSLAASHHLSAKIDWQRVRELVLRRDGIARDVSRASTEEEE